MMTRREALKGELGKNLQGANPAKKARMDPGLNQKIQLVPCMRSLNQEIDTLLSSLPAESKSIVRTTPPEQIESGSPLQAVALHFCTLVAKSKSAQKVLQEHREEWINDPQNLPPALLSTVEKATVQPPQWRPAPRATKKSEDQTEKIEHTVATEW
eukprot:1215226-Amphidinium_carterae.1